MAARRPRKAGSVAGKYDPPAMKGRIMHGSIRRAFRFAHPSALLLGCIALASCGLHIKGVEALPREDGGGNGSAYMHPFPPTDVRINPLTRIIPPSGEQDARIEVHVELLDRFSHPVKALGMLHFELREGGQGREGEPSQVKRWEVDLREPRLHEEPYDRVTRTYRFFLEGVPSLDAGDAQYTLRARFITGNGRRLTHGFTLGDGAGGD